MKLGKAVRKYVDRQDMETAVNLLKSGANPNVQTDEGVPLIIACLSQEARLIDLLLKSGADPNVQDQNEGFALSAAASGASTPSASATFFKKPM